MPSLRIPDIRDMATFRQAHLLADEVVKTYLAQCRRTGQTLPPGVHAELEPCGPDRRHRVEQLYANNAWARIKMAETSERIVMSDPDVLDAREVYFVTLTPGQYVRRIDDAAEFETRVIQAWTRQLLRGHQFIGMVEAAMFPHYPAADSYNVSWHVHLLVWKTTYRCLNRTTRDLNARYTSFVDTAPVATIRRMRTSRDIASKLIYMLKAPQKQYHAYCPPGENIN